MHRGPHGGKEVTPRHLCSHNVVEALRTVRGARRIWPSDVATLISAYMAEAGDREQPSR